MFTDERDMLVREQIQLPLTFLILSAVDFCSLQHVPFASWEDVQLRDELPCSREVYSSQTLEFANHKHLALGVARLR